MLKEHTNVRIVWENTGEENLIDVSTLIAALSDFLDHFGDRTLLGREFYTTIGTGDGATKRERLLSACGYPEDAGGFFTDVLTQLGKADGTQKIVVNGIELPHLLLMAILEIVLPGNGFVTVRTVEQFEKMANRKVPQSERTDLQAVIDTYPVRLSMHTIRQMRLSHSVAYQYAPFVEELDPVGQTNTWIGQFHQGLLEQMYQNRVIFLINMSCPVYCRFCFRKHKESRNQKNPTQADVQAAIDYIRKTPTIKEIVVTGGDPFLNKKNMLQTIDGLKAVPHVQSLRLATRSISYYPHLFYEKEAFWLNYLKMKNLELQQMGKRIEVATHFIHPDEISLDSLDVISELTRNGVAVYVQTPFLNNCNDEGPELARLFSLLRGAGAELHYIYIPCSPIHGNSVYWVPISKGMAAAHYLRAHLSDRIMPRICTATPIGKIDWFSSGWAVEKDAENDQFLWIRTPYDPEYFKPFAQNVEAQEVVRVNREGTLDARFMAQIGDENLLRGSREARPVKTASPDPAALEKLQATALKDQRIGYAIVPAGSDKLRRVHETRVEMDPKAGAAELDTIRKDARITDVVLSAAQDAIEHLYDIEALIASLAEVPHVNAVRLRSFKFNYQPGIYTKGVVSRLGSMNRLRVANPLRLEIETQFLVPEEIKPEHAILAKTLRNRGVTVYCNTPILATVNDTADQLHRLAFDLRQAGIEFHHIYVAGWSLQEDWSREHPVDLTDVIDIATKIRRDGSGREIPRYVILTRLGEVDFGLTSRFLVKNDQVFVKLLPYNLAYYRGMHPEFSWPDSVQTDDDDRPVVRLDGVINPCSVHTDDSNKMD